MKISLSMTTTANSVNSPTRSVSLPKSVDVPQSSYLRTQVHEWQITVDFINQFLIVLIDKMVNIYNIRTRNSSYFKQEISIKPCNILIFTLFYWLYHTLYILLWQYHFSEFLSNKIIFCCCLFPL
jgi:hypothetical protein